MNFVDFHIHTKYTVGNGLSDIQALTKKAKKFGYKSLAITDSGSIKGFRDFGINCLKRGIKPIFGCGFYFAPLGLESDTTQHLVLIAKDIEGYKNLITLSKYSFNEGLGNKPRIDFNSLGLYNKGLACLTGGLGGVFDKPYLAGNEDLALSNINKLKDLFSSNIYLELQDNGLDNNKKMISKLSTLSSELGIELIATGGSFYIEKEDSIVCNKLRSSNGNKQLTGCGYYFKSSEEIMDNFKLYPKAIENSFELNKQIILTIKDVMSVGMRRKDREIFNNDTILDIFKRNIYCRIALSDNNVPYIVSLNYGYRDGYLYFHSATDGKKITISNKNPNVCYEISDSVKLIKGKYAWDYTTSYRSLIGNSRVEFITDLDEKLIAIQAIMDQVEPVSLGEPGKDWGFPNKMIAELTLFKIRTKGVSCKISKGSE